MMKMTKKKKKIILLLNFMQFYLNKVKLYFSVINVVIIVGKFYVRLKPHDCFMK